MTRASWYVMLLWAILLVLFLLFPQLASPQQNSKSYTIYDNKGNVVRRVVCMYGTCHAYDTRWYPRETWTDPPDLDQYGGEPIVDQTTGDRYSGENTDYN